VTKPDIARPDWDEQYSAGRWDYLADSSEAHRYGVLAGYARKSGAHHILDIGCGNGLLYRELGGPSFNGSYLGIDWSISALPRGPHGAGHNFICGDASNLPLRSTFDLIVLSEVLYYLPDPEATVRELRKMLRPTGLLLISVYQPPENRPSRWRETVRDLDCLLTQDFGAIREQNIIDQRRDRVWALYKMDREV
jgi:SAM-dependent methyltransferase